MASWRILRCNPLNDGGLDPVPAAPAACSAAASPQGWAPPQPIQPGGKQLIIAAHRAKLYALPTDGTTPVWQFPPADRNTYPVSQVNAAALNSRIDGLGISDQDKS